VQRGFRIVKPVKVGGKNFSKEVQSVHSLVNLNMVANPVPYYSVYCSYYYYCILSFDIGFIVLSVIYIAELLPASEIPAAIDYKFCDLNIIC